MEVILPEGGWAYRDEGLLGALCRKMNLIRVRLRCGEVSMETVCAFRRITMQILENYILFRMIDIRK
jgi:hypothetical protein